MAIILGIDTSAIDLAPDTFSAAYDGQDGFSHKNRFLMLIDFPNFVNPKPNPETTNLMVESATMPGNRVLVKEYQFDGPQKKIPYSTAVEELTVSFLLTGNYSIYVAFSQWLEAIINMDIYSIAYKNDITMDMEVYQLDKENKKTLGKKMISAFPIMLSPLEFSNTTPNDLQRVNVTFVFDRYDIITHKA